VIQRALRPTLGRLQTGSVHIVLSTRDQDEGRFLRRPRIYTAGDNDEIEDFDNVEAELNRRFPRAFYAHAVPIETTTSLAAPAAADEQSHAQRPPRWSLGASVGVRAAAAA
jgi:hypothetical protein